MSKNTQPFFYLGFLWWHRRYRGHQSSAAGAEASHQAQRQCQRRNNMSHLWGGSTRERQTSFALWWYLLLLLSSLLSSVTSGDQDAQFWVPQRRRLREMQYYHKNQAEMSKVQVRHARRTDHKTSLINDAPTVTMIEATYTLPRVHIP